MVRSTLHTVLLLLFLKYNDRNDNVLTQDAASSIMFGIKNISVNNIDKNHY